MSETREQFRERIGTVNKRETESRPVTEEEAFRYWPEEVDFANGAEAVYVQALRDFKEHLLSKGFEPDNPEFFAAETDVFAAERGIEIGGES